LTEIKFSDIKNCILHTFHFILEIIFLIYFSYISLYTLIFSIAGLYYKKPKLHYSLNKSKFLVLIPAYKEDAIIFEVAKKALEQQYPADKFQVVIIADSMQQSTIKKLKTLQITTLLVSFENSTKVKALNFALQKIENGYDYAVILDADNIMDTHFLEIMNDLHQQGYSAIQGYRAAKNQNNTLSYLDGLSEEINNHIFCKGSTQLRLSSSLKGSGMSFKYELLKVNLKKMDSVGGFDRELELLLIEDGVKVRYAKSAVVYDEKVEESKVFESQRKRWIASQFFYLRQYFVRGFKNLLKGKFTFFNSSVLRNAQLPRLLNLGINFLLIIVFYFFREHLFINYYIWLGIFAINVGGVLAAIPRKYYNHRLFFSMLILPIIFWKMLLLLFNLKNANKKFIHTPHNSSQK